VLNFDRSTVKHALHNTQNDCQSVSPCFNAPSFSAGGSAPDSAVGAYSASPDPLAGLRGPTAKDQGRWGKRRRGEKTGRGSPLTQIPGSPMVPRHYSGLTETCVCHITLIDLCGATCGVEAYSLYVRGIANPTNSSVSDIVGRINNMCRCVLCARVERHKNSG